MKQTHQVDGNLSLCWMKIIGNAKIIKFRVPALTTHIHSLTLPSSHHISIITSLQLSRRKRNVDSISAITHDCPSIRPSVCPSVRPSVHPSVHLFVHPSIRLSICPSIRPSVCPFVCPSILSLNERETPWALFFFPWLEENADRRVCQVFWQSNKTPRNSLEADGSRKKDTLTDLLND